MIPSGKVFMILIEKIVILYFAATLTLSVFESVIKYILRFE